MDLLDIQRRGRQERSSQVDKAVPPDKTFEQHVQTFHERSQLLQGHLPLEERKNDDQLLGELARSVYKDIKSQMPNLEPEKRSRDNLPEPEPEPQTHEGGQSPYNLARRRQIKSLLLDDEDDKETLEAFEAIENGLSLKLQRDWEDFGGKAQTDRSYEWELGRYTSNLVEIATGVAQINKILHDMESMFIQVPDHFKQEEQLREKYVDLKEHYIDNVKDKSITCENLKKIAAHPGGRQNFDFSILTKFREETSEEIDAIAKGFTDAGHSFKQSPNKETLEKLRKEWNALLLQTGWGKPQWPRMPSSNREKFRL